MRCSYAGRLEHPSRYFASDRGALQIATGLRTIAARCVDVTRTQYRALRELQERERWDWPATFSVNPAGEVWPFVTYGYARREERRNIRHLSSIIDDVADRFLQVGPDGGRLFVSESGAFVAKNREQFVYFQIVEPVVPTDEDPVWVEDTGVAP